MIRWQDRITCTPGVMGGQPCIAGTRITLGTVLANLAARHTFDEILAEYPTLNREDLQAVVAYGANRPR
jgi:uncharacterized protein (DUF433 family)